MFVSSANSRSAVILLLVLVATTAAFADLSEDFVPLRDDHTIEYATRPTHDPISILTPQSRPG
jgi:hypothetical protein